MKRKIGFIGLGNMGLPMAKNLVKAGNELIVFDMNPIAMSMLSDSEVQKVSSPAEAAAQSEITITMLPSTPHVKQVATGSKGILDGIRPGCIYIDMSTISPIFSQELAKTFKDAGCYMLDAPVSRGQPAAIEGTLVIMVGGAEEIFNQSLEIFGKMGTDIFYCGPSGSGSVVKLVNNMVVGGIILATLEGLIMGVKAKVDLKTILKVIKKCSANSYMLENYFPIKLFNGSFKPGFTLDMMKKDLALVHDFALNLECPLFFSSLSQQLFEMAHMKGLGDLDVTAIAQLLEDMAKVQVRFSDTEP